MSYKPTPAPYYGSSHRVSFPCHYARDCIPLDEKDFEQTSPSFIFQANRGHRNDMAVDFSDLVDFDFDVESDSQTHMSWHTEPLGSVTPDFDGFFDSPTNDSPKQPYHTSAPSEYPDPEMVKYPFATSPYSPSGRAPAATMATRYPQTSMASAPQREPSRWIPCAPPPGIPRHPPPPQFEPSRWVPCAPPPGYPKQMPRQQQEPSRWTPCAPPPGQPAYIPRSALMPPRGKISPPPVARMPFHHPDISERLGLQKYCSSPVSYPSPVPRSTPARGLVSPAGSTNPVSSTIDPAVLGPVKPLPRSPPCEILPNINRGLTPGQPVKTVESPTKSVPNPGPVSAGPSQRRRGSIHAEDLYGSDEESEGSDLDLSPTSSSPVNPTPAALPCKRKSSGPKSSRVSQPGMKRRKLLAEIQDTDEFIQSQDQEVDSDDDDIDLTPLRQRRKLKGKGNSARRSLRQKTRVASYAEE